MKDDTNKQLKEKRFSKEYYSNQASAENQTIILVQRITWFLLIVTAAFIFFDFLIDFVLKGQWQFSTSRLLMMGGGLTCTLLLLQLHQYTLAKHFLIITPLCSMIILPAFFPNKDMVTEFYLWTHFLTVIAPSLSFLLFKDPQDQKNLLISLSSILFFHVLSDWIIWHLQFKDNPFFDIELQKLVELSLVRLALLFLITIISFYYNKNQHELQKGLLAESKKHEKNLENLKKNEELIEHIQQELAEQSEEIISRNEILEKYLYEQSQNLKGIHQQNIEETERHLQSIRAYLCTLKGLIYLSEKISSKKEKKEVRTLYSKTIEALDLELYSINPTMRFSKMSQTQQISPKNTTKS